MNQSPEPYLFTKPRLLKKLVLLVFCLGGTLNFVAQDYHEFPLEDGNKWYNGLLAIGLGFCGWITDAIVVDGDTLIEGLEYKKIYFEAIQDSWFGFEPDDGEYLGALRENDDQQVFYFPSSQNPFPGCYFDSDSSEYLLYDFSLEIGDTLPLEWHCGLTAETLVVLELDSVLLEDGYHKRMLYSNANQAWYPNYHIEGLGATWGLLAPYYEYDGWGDCTNPGYKNGVLSCFESPNLSYTTDNESVFPDCTIINSVPNSSVVNWTFRPNPADNQLQIFDAASGSVMTITDYSGKIVHSETMSSTRQFIDTAHLENGMYILTINNQSRLLSIVHR